VTATERPRLKHEQVARVLETEIRRGSVPFGRQLPGEAALAERFSVSRNTVRAALSELGEAGLIATRSGKGSFVTFDGRPLDVKLGWARAMHEQGVDARVEVLRLEQVTDAELAAELGERGEGADRFILVERLRRVEDGTPVSYERSRIPATPLAVAAFGDGLAGASLTELLLECGLVPARGEQWVQVRRLEGEDARLLERDPGESFLWSRCVTRDSAGALVESVESLLDPAHFSLHLSFSAR
jgi:GntR family transcriptional regulator